MDLTTPIPVRPSGPTYFRALSDQQPTQLSWDEVLTLVRDNLTVQHHTELAVAARRAGDDKDYDRCKRLSGAITPSAHCQGGHAFKHVRSFTGYVCADFDHIDGAAQVQEVKARLCALPYVMLCWITASQQGLRVIVPYGVADGTPPAELSVAQFKRVWGMVNQALGVAAGMPYDDKVNDPTRLSFLSHDAAVYHNATATPFPIDVVMMHEEKRRRSPRKSTAQDNEAMSAEQCFRQAVAIVERNEGQHYEEGNRNNYVMRIACVLNRMGLPVEQATAYCRNHYGDLGDEELCRTIESAYGHAAEFGIWHGDDSRHPRHDKGHRETTRLPLASREEVEEFLQQHYEVRKNEITNSVEWRRRGDSAYAELRDYELNSIWRRVSMALNKQVALNVVWNTLNSDFSPMHNPLTHFLTQGTRPWQEGRDPDYVAQLAAGVHTTAAPAFFLHCLKKWMVGMVAGIMSPLKNQAALVIVGPQGIGKTIWCSKLWPNTEALKRYFLCTSNTDFGNKDMRLAFTEFALICLDEIDQLNSRELNSLKSLMTAESMQERAAYERTKMRRNNCASVCGTGNDKQFLTDTTGNRRWLAFECTSIDDAVAMTVDYAGLYGQLMTLWQSGYHYWFDAMEMAELEEYLVQFEVSCPEKELIQRYFYLPDKTYYRSDAIGCKVAIVPVFMTTTEIMKYIADNYRGFLSLQAVGRAMAKLGYSRIKRSRRWGYVVVPRDSNEIFSQSERDAMESNPNDNNK